ncbi:hypothetical protein Pden_3408 [Paracoccus denitrificans PD1222]|uniref:Uncharacterized protein n=1 Tax=Paracoccus denitrificans (strain Pd 1222) TaxID=318586 RepID=A1B7I5_PARDP|nr:hypothetical protein Pden_3408 [Paracoccus denitrificans PD1222]
MTGTGWPGKFFILDQHGYTVFLAKSVRKWTSPGLSDAGAVSRIYLEALSTCVILFCSHALMFLRNPQALCDAKECHALLLASRQIR